MVERKVRGSSHSGRRMGLGVFSSKKGQRRAGSASGLAAASTANRCFYTLAENWTLPIGWWRQLIPIIQQKYFRFWPPGEG
jgi:hypothetical protein